MAKLDKLSQNLLMIKMSLQRNSDITKYLVGENTVLPYKFDDTVDDTQTSEIRVYFGNIQFKNGEVIQDINVLFDIIVANDLWEMNGRIRPYEIMSQIINTFDGKSIETVGELHFTESTMPIKVNSSYQCIRLVARMMQVGE